MRPSPAPALVMQISEVVGKRSVPESSRLSETIRAFPLHTSLLAACVLLGLFLRTRGMFHAVIPLWLDEAVWVPILLDTPLLEPSIRPLGFMALSKLIANALGPGEVALRLLPWLAGMLTTVLSVPLARVLFRSRAAQFVVVASIALHPFAIDYSKEFKPYAISLLFHVVCLIGAASYAKTLSFRTLLATLSVALPSVLFAQDMLFAYPALYVVLGLCAWRARRRPHIIATLLAGAATLALVLTLAVRFWMPLRAGERSSTNYWGGKYGVFYVPGKGAPSRMRWFATQYAGLAAFPAERRVSFGPVGPIQTPTVATLQEVVAAIWVCLHLLGLIVLVSRRRTVELVLFALPLGICILFNRLGLWPFGAFRTNLFALAYLVPIAAFTFEGEARPRVEAWRLVGALSLIILPLLLFERDWHKQKVYAGPSVFLEAVDELIYLQGRRYEGRQELLVLDAYSCRVWSYYFTLHPQHRSRRRELERRFSKRCTSFRESTPALFSKLSAQEPRRMWMMLTQGEQIEEAARASGEGRRHLERTPVGDGYGLIVSLGRVPKRGRRQ